MASVFGKEGSQGEASCALWRVDLERKGHKEKRLVTHGECILERRVTRRSVLCPMASRSGKERSQGEASCDPWRVYFGKKGHKEKRLVLIGESVQLLAYEH
ncbi:hypothetical protein ACM26V_16540 [Salipaludibacillus sp. HK11]|uniref:hypothetical protein n=1 Tax=Salipaludibacillus sp. HK11 TaxID=3394320 RepID=UPI0039FC6550